jgi:hypothetical protein
MATTKGSDRISSVSGTINPQKQTLDQVNRLVALALGRAGCERCGRLAFFEFKFLGDPGPDFNKVGAISIDVR